MIPYFDYRPAYRELEGEIREAMTRVLESGRLVLGPEVEAFEREFADHLGASGAVGVNSGTDALALALRALGIGRDDEVLTVANAGVPPVAAIRLAGATPRFVDVDPESLLIDPAGLEPALTPRCRCVLVVHLYGQPAPLDEILRFAARHGLHVVEDCAQAHGTTHRGAPVGGFGDAACFSFYPTKNLGAFGDGGICVTSSPEVERRIRMLRTYGYAGGDRHAHVEGWNSRLDEIQAAILRVKLARLDRTIEARRELAREYHEALRGSSYRLPGVGADDGHGFHLFVIRAPDRSRTIEALRREGIGFGIHYPEPVHLMEAYRFLGYRRGSLPVSERASEEVLSLPLYPGLGVEAVREVARALREAG